MRLPSFTLTGGLAGYRAGREQGEMFSDVEAALDECCNEDMIIHLEISPLVVEADRKELFESPKSARTGSRHVRFAYEIVMKSL